MPSLFKPWAPSQTVLAKSQVCELPRVACNVCPVDGSALEAVGGHGILPKKHVEIDGGSGVSVVTRFLLDNGSQFSFISSRLAKALKLQVVRRESWHLQVVVRDAPFPNGAAGYAVVSGANCV